MDQEMKTKRLEELQSESEERRRQLEEEFSYDGYKYVRGELFANLRQPAITIRNGSITFNTACINGLEDVVYVNLMVNEDLQRLVVKGCSENDKDALRWCVAKPDKRKSRKMNCPDFTKLVYDMMGWETCYRYKIAGYRIVHEGEVLYVFDLTVHKIFRETGKKGLEGSDVAEEGAEEGATGKKGFFPDNVAGTFGLPVEEHERLKEVRSLDGFITIGALTGEIPKKAVKPDADDQNGSETDPVIIKTGEHPNAITAEALEEWKE